jgi:hypothetical protein
MSHTKIGIKSLFQKDEKLFCGLFIRLNSLQINGNAKPIFGNLKSNVYTHLAINENAEFNFRDGKSKFGNDESKFGNDKSNVYIAIVINANSNSNF